jgi:hypothetical protein
VYANHQTSAQSDGQVEDRVVVIEKESKLDLPQANRNFEKAITLPTNPSPKQQSYTPNEVLIEVPKVSSKVKVPQLNDELLDKLYGNYIKAGLGNYGTTNLEGYFSLKRSEKYQASVLVNHLASANGSVKSERVDNFSRNSLNSVGANFQYFLPKSTLETSINWARQRINYYGYNTDTLDKSPNLPQSLLDNVKQVYQTLEITGGISNEQPNEKFNYKIKSHLFHFSDRFKANETELYINSSMKYELSKNDGLAAYFTFSNAHRKDSSSINRILMNIKPLYFFNWDIYTFKVGANVAFNNDTLSNMNKIHFYPVLYAQANIEPQKLIAFVSLDGEMKKNTLRTFVSENPFIGSNQLLSHTNKSLELHAGIRGLLANKFDYSVKTGYCNFKNLYFFNNDFKNDSSRFEIIYSPQNVGLLYFNSNLSYHFNTKFKAGIDLQLNHYAISSKDTLLKTVLHRPTSLLTMYATYNLGNKIYFNLNFYYIGGIKALRLENLKPVEVSLNPAVDISAQVKYKVSETFNAYLELNNVLNNKYQTYQNYISQGINMMLGLSYSF